MYFFGGYEGLCLVLGVNALDNNILQTALVTVLLLCCNSGCLCQLPLKHGQFFWNEYVNAYLFNYLIAILGENLTDILVVQLRSN